MSWLGRGSGFSMRNWRSWRVTAFSMPFDGAGDWGFGSFIGCGLGRLGLGRAGSLARRDSLRFLPRRVERAPEYPRQSRVLHSIVIHFAATGISFPVVGLKK